ncbi:hypothetical protein PVAND_015347 [Polypedilum vanderplanki]|uniref:F-box domain-containing protein n=1 Tax=Polypedilum vanderplanki TaxID=319348 RepID=A0A9J6BC02_POLVA|nr:hypothetical protein PVAND_015347 [Polypedilum vanderplanki]
MTEKVVYNFPVEVLVKIIKNIPKYHRKDFSLISRNFYEAICVLNEEISWNFSCPSQITSDAKDQIPDYLADYESFLKSETEECQVIVSSIDHAVMNFFRDFGARVKELKFLNLIEFSKYYAPKSYD